jgi:hypothetical protein
VEPPNKPSALGSLSKKPAATPEPATAPEQTRKSSAFQEIVKGHAPAPAPEEGEREVTGEPEDEKDIAAYKLARPRSREDMMLGVFFKNGAYKALDYSMMHPVDMPHPDTIELTFGRGVADGARHQG